MLVTPTLVLSHKRSDSEPSHSNESDILPNNLIEIVTTPQPSKLVVPIDSALYTVLQMNRESVIHVCSKTANLRASQPVIQTPNPQ